MFDNYNTAFSEENYFTRKEVLHGRKKLHYKINKLFLKNYDIIYNFYEPEEVQGRTSKLEKEIGFMFQYFGEKR